MAGQKPDTRVVLKNKQTGKTELTLASYWTDRDMPSGGLDKSVKRITIDWEDREGNQQRTVVDNRKDTMTHYANLQIWKGEDAQQARPATQKARKPAADLPPDDADDPFDPEDPCPF